MAERHKGGVRVSSSGGRHFGVDNRYNDSYTYRANNTRRPPPRRRNSNNNKNGGRFPFGGVLAIITVLVVVVCAVIVAKNMNLFGTTLADPNASSSNLNEPSSNISEQSTPSNDAQPKPAETTPPEAVSSVPEASPEPTLPPVEGGAEYTKKYPDMWVEQPVVSEVDPDDKVVYLTFDDGPCDSSDRLLDVLDELGIKATFFYTAQFMDDDGIVENIKRAYDRGHGVAVHTYTHDYGSVYATVDSYLDDFKKMDDLIVRATGEHTKIYRHPGGSNTGYNEHIRSDMLKEMKRRGFVHYDWNVSNDDAAGADFHTQLDLVLGNLPYNNRNIVLMHNTPGKGTTIDSLYKIVPKAIEMGYRFAVLDETVKPIQFTTAEDE